MSADDCIFCKIVAGDIPCLKIYEDDTVLSFLDIGPLSEGHTLVISKEHFERIHSCPADLVGKISEAIVPIAGAVVRATNADGYNVLCNNGRAAGQLVEHVHFHIIPRNNGDGVFNRWPAKQYEKGRAEEIVQKICDELK